mgnify:FL=1|tara:strand:- start:1661 stop:3136 length:1476 start_codon:yes stop_codon:yes gene_type:complete
MPLIPLQIPSGVYRNGTDFQGSNRWRDVNLVRWVDNTMRPVRGWESRVSLGTTAPRAAIAWQDTTTDRWLAAGFHDKLVASTESNVVTDITPSDLTDGTLDAVSNIGFGGGFYGLGFYGTERADTGNYSEATTWSLDNFGSYLVACSTADGRLLEWPLNTGVDAAPIANAPINNLGLLVTEERFLFALGAGGNPRKVQFSDREDNTLWTPAATNEAGDIELQTSGQIMQGIRTRGQSLIITDVDAHSVTYIGGQFVYSFQRVGSSCGAISRKAAAAVDEGVFWMGQRGFFAYAGGAVQDIPCEVADYVFNDMNTAQASKIWSVTNQQYNEIWWWYPSEGSNEIDRYVSYNYKENHWSIGQLSRTAGFDRGVFRRPIWLKTDGDAYNHDTGLNYEGADIFAESGPISLGAGDNVMSATMLIPDELTQGDVEATFKTRFHPNDVERSYGPYAMANPTSVRFTGRQVRMRVEGAKLADWRVGVMRLDAVAGSKR